MSISSRLITADELFDRPDDGKCYELIAGELSMMVPPGFEHGAVVSLLTALLTAYVKDHRLGIVVSGDVGFLVTLDPDTVLAPDIAFVQQSRIAVLGIVKKYFPGPPDLAVEIASPNDRPSEIKNKAIRWLTNGADRVWIVNPNTHTVQIHSAAGEIIELGSSDRLDGGELLPGFSCLVADLFPNAR